MQTNQRRFITIWGHLITVHLTPVDASYSLNEPRRAFYHILLMGKVVQPKDNYYLLLTSRAFITFCPLDKHLKAVPHVLKWCLVGALHSIHSKLRIK